MTNISSKEGAENTPLSTVFLEGSVTNDSFMALILLLQYATVGGQAKDLKVTQCNFNNKNKRKITSILDKCVNVLNLSNLHYKKITIIKCKNGQNSDENDTNVYYTQLQLLVSNYTRISPSHFRALL